MRPMGSRAALILWAPLALLLHAAAWPRDALGRAAGLTVREGIETTRFATDRRHEAVFIAPDRRRYAVVLITGDVERDGVWVDIRVGGLEAMAAATPRRVARLFTRGLGGTFAAYFGSSQLVAPAGNPPVWLDDHTLALLWSDDRGLRQVLAVNVDSGVRSWLTAHETAVLKFAAATPRTFLFSAGMPLATERSSAREQHGYVVTDADAIELLHGGVRGLWDWMRHETFVVTPSHPRPRRVEFDGGEAVSRYLPRVIPVYSPDGRYALLAHTVRGAQIPREWERYTQQHFRDMWQARSDLTGFYARQFQKLFVVDLEHARARAVWDVPVDGLGRTRIAWSPAADEVVIAPTFLPPSVADDTALDGDAVAVVDVATGRFERIPLAPGVSAEITHLTWPRPDRIEADLLGGRRLGWQRTAGSWQSRGLATTAPPREAVRVEVREDLNLPPSLWAVDTATGRSKRLLDPNPGLAPARLGHVEWLRLPRETGTGAWEGRLYYPLRYIPGHRYPLVIQTYAFAGSHEFSLYGHEAPALGPGRSAYIAQALAGRDMFVLHGPSRAEGIEEVERTLDALEHAVRTLAARGLVDSDRVGIMGFSASGWLTTYALSRGKFRYAAALTDDNKDGSYMQAALSGWEFAAGEEMIGAAPFGAGLQRWLRYSPAMNVERMHTPLLITRSSPASPLNGWELFSRLRYLHKPVEYYVIPDVEHGSHELQNPHQLASLQERALDWWRYWLRGERDPDSRKQAQYEHWDELRRLGF
jgi:dienelactone hydrolase